MMILARRAATARTLLFVPGTRPDRFDKAVASGADVVILDLEDAVAVDDKTAARNHVSEWLKAGNEAVVRVNASTSMQFEDDIASLEGTGCVVMLPKAHDVHVLTSLAANMPVIALVETARGVLAAPAISAIPGVLRLALGHIDLSAELGVDPSERAAFVMARSALVLAAAAAGIDSPIDGVTTNLSDHEALRSDVAYAKALGFSGKLCNHPSQTAVAAETLSPTSDELAWAEKVTASLPSGGGVVSVDGHMIDPPVVARAERILASRIGRSVFP